MPLIGAIRAHPVGKRIDVQGQTVQGHDTASGCRPMFGTKRECSPPNPLNQYSAPAATFTGRVLGYERAQLFSAIPNGAGAVHSRRWNEMSVATVVRATGHSVVGRSQ